MDISIINFDTSRQRILDFNSGFNLEMDCLSKITVGSIRLYYTHILLGRLKYRYTVRASNNFPSSA